MVMVEWVYQILLLAHLFFIPVVAVVEQMQVQVLVVMAAAAQVFYIHPLQVALQVQLILEAAAVEGLLKGLLFLEEPGVLEWLFFLYPLQIILVLQQDHLQ
jgi:hypothetical protein